MISYFCLANCKVFLISKSSFINILELNNIYIKFQMALLLLFEKSDSLNFKELHATTKMSEEQFPRYVQSLIDAKLLTSNTEVMHLFVT